MREEGGGGGSDDQSVRGSQPHLPEAGSEEQSGVDGSQTSLLPPTAAVPPESESGHHKWIDRSLVSP